jgi:hypothetical protein
MATYTELKLKFTLKENIDPFVLDLLRKVLIDKNFPTEPNVDHEFFKNDKWYMLFIANNFDETKQSIMNLKGARYEIEIHSEFKNALEQIDLFIDWITPYVLGRKAKQYLGYYRVEGMTPINIYIKRK